MSSECFILQKTFFIRFWGTDEKICKKCENIHVFLIFVFGHTYGNKCYFMLSCFNRQFEYVNRIIL